MLHQQGEKGEGYELSQTYNVQEIHRDITNSRRPQIQDTSTFKKGFEGKNWDRRKR